MKILLFKDAKEMAREAAVFCKAAIESAQAENGAARIVLSTGASQLPFFEEFVRQDIDFSGVEMFHLDEYVGVDETHIASFKRYLKERFTDKVKLKAAHLIDGTQDPRTVIESLTAEVGRAPIDLGLIGIGENAHIAFNDPPADFDDEAAFKVVNLSESCKAQQVREKWFARSDEVCKQAITMTCREIMKCKKILSIVPYAVKAQAVYNMLTQDKNTMTPATLLKEHPDFTLMLDADSASLINTTTT
ncbi:MAG: 6-phosphogluconolactonase [Firmicutes bacterium]|nr:6-phosphogluconolactonase [Bacillota bacterium]